MQSSIPILETERLYLRELTVHDAEYIYFLNLDADVLKYTGDKCFESIESARHFLASYDHYKKYGFGRWAVNSKANDEFLGWCGLRYSADTSRHDIGFRFFKKYWGEGFASESAKACIDLGFNKFHMSTIYGRAVKENIASLRVLEKIGMTYFESIDFDGKAGVVYTIDKPESPR